MSGPIATEYAAQVTEATRPRRTPPRSPERPLDAPAATSATPENEVIVAIQCRVWSRSRPNACAMSATKIGNVPNMSATVAAVVSRTEYANESWLIQIPSAAATITIR